MLYWKHISTLKASSSLECYCLTTTCASSLHQFSPFPCASSFSPIGLFSMCYNFCHLFKNIYLFIYLFIYFWLRWVFIAARGLSLVVVSRGHSSLRRTGFSLWWLLLLWSTGSRCVGFSSCGMWAQ